MKCSLTGPWILDKPLDFTEIEKLTILLESRGLSRGYLSIQTDGVKDHHMVHWESDGGSKCLVLTVHPERWIGYIPVSKEELIEEIISKK